MSKRETAVGFHPPQDINVIVEVPFGGPPVKYELDKKTGRMVVDRYLRTPMVYPGNYGFVPNTLSLDGDPIDVLIWDKNTLVPGAVINCRPIGVLLMEDEAGMDEKIIAVPSNRVTPEYRLIIDHSDLPISQVQQIEYFFQHYKDLEPTKWVEVKGWQGAERAKELIVESIDLAKMTSRPAASLALQMR